MPLIDPHPLFCPEWEYKRERANFSEVLHVQNEFLLTDMCSGPLDLSTSAQDTRSIHLRLFRELVPITYDYFAGHYRGEKFVCLEHYTVGVQSDPRVGARPTENLLAMYCFRSRIIQGLRSLDTFMASSVPEHIKLLQLVAFACHAFEIFLRIHPYANGNGHAARFLIWCILGKYNYWPVRWPIEPRPPDPPYTSLIVECRNGNPDPLIQFVLKCIDIN